jgi:hypothetical protein
MVALCNLRMSASFRTMSAKGSAAKVTEVRVARFLFPARQSGAAADQRAAA